MTLGSTLKKLEKDGGVVIHGAMKTAFEKLYGYTSDSDGIRHGGIDDIVNIGLHFFLKDVRPMLPPVMNRSIVDA